MSRTAARRLLASALMKNQLLGPAKTIFGLIASAAMAASAAVAAPPKPARACLSDCTPRIGIVSAFGQEAAILVAQTQGRRSYTVNGNRFTTGTLRGNRVVIVLSGVSMINSTMVTQLMLDHFKVERLLMSGISGGLNPAQHIGDVMVPERWAMPMEVYWHEDSSVPAPCGAATDVSCLGLRLAQRGGQPLPPFELPNPQAAPRSDVTTDVKPSGKRIPVPTGLFIRENFVMNAANAPQGEFRFEYPVDAAMLAVVRQLRPTLARCGPKAGVAASAADGAAPDPKLCVARTPQLVVGGLGVSGTAFVANASYRRYLFEVLQAQTVEMETAALAHVAYANGVPYLAFRSLSDLAGGEAFDADVAALFTSGLAEANEAAVTLAFLEAWAQRKAAK